MITGIILASGFSRRMEKDKLLLEIDGEKIIEKIIKACKESNLDDVILIYRREEVKEIGIKYKVKTVYNENAAEGQSAGMKLGVKEAGNTNAYMFIVGDQPFLTWEIINKLIKEYNETKSSIVAPYYKGHRGMPIIFSSTYKEELLKVEGDKGGRDIVKNNISKVLRIDVEDERTGIDIDTLEDLHKIL